MGTPSDEQPMSDIEILVQQSLKYTEIIHEYCSLASVRSLTQPQANRLEEILKKAQSDPWLDFLIDEADHIVAHQLGFINKPFIKYQQNELKNSIYRLWSKRILHPKKN